MPARISVGALLRVQLDAGGASQGGDLGPRGLAFKGFFNGAPLHCFKRGPKKPQRGRIR